MQCELLTKILTKISKKFAIVRVCAVFVMCECKQKLVVVELITRPISFAYLFVMCLQAYGDSSQVRNNYGLDIITIVGCCISLFATFLTIISLIVAW